MNRRIIVSRTCDDSARAVLLSAPLFIRFIETVAAIHAGGFKAFGLFATPAEGGRDHVPSDVYFLDPTRNQRNHEAHRPTFEAQGAYFRRHHDAGFVADPADVRELEERARREGQVLVAPFHSHRRQPANFSLVDYRLHNPLFGWHLVVSMRDPARPDVQPFVVEKPLEAFGLDDARVVDGEGERDYIGGEVRPVTLLVEGRSHELERVQRLLDGGLAPAAASAA
jgi:proteasome lid subunit RPN8/RPN11